MSSEKLPPRFDVKALTDAALQKLYDAAAAELEARESAKREEVSQQIVQMAKANRINLATLVPSGEKAELRTYRDPKNQWNTWKGKGRKPKWLKEYLDAGRPIEDFLVPLRGRKRRKT